MFCHWVVSLRHKCYQKFTTFTSAAEFVRRYTRPENLSRPWHHWLRVSPQAHPQGESFKHSHKNTQAAGNTHTHTDTPTTPVNFLPVWATVCVCSWESWTCEENAIVNQSVFTKGIAHDHDNNRSENVRCVGKPLQKQVRVKGGGAAWLPGDSTLHKGE